MSVCNSIPAHIHPHLSRSRLILKTNRVINKQYL